MRFKTFIVLAIAIAIGLGGYSIARVEHGMHQQGIELAQERLNACKFKLYDLAVGSEGHKVHLTKGPQYNPHEAEVLAGALRVVLTIPSAKECIPVIKEAIHKQTKEGLTPRLERELVKLAEESTKAETLNERLPHVLPTEPAHKKHSAPTTHGHKHHTTPPGKKPNPPPSPKAPGPASGPSPSNPTPKTPPGHEKEKKTPPGKTRVPPGKVEVPSVETPKVKTPKVETPPIKTPPIEVPPITVPPIEVPPITVPSIEVPPIKTPKVEVEVNGVLCKVLPNKLLCPKTE